VQVVAILADQFAGVPRIAQPDIVTLLEEDRITGYYAGGHLYAEPARMGPIL
jgi:photosynthetic reaction center H subunit